MTPQEIRQALREPFPPDRIGWKPGAVSGNRALALAYIDARDVMDRLDDVVGQENWYDVYDNFGDSIRCHLHVRIGTEWIAKSDVGSLSDQDDTGDQLKAGFSDALKRAAIKWGIGRYLYSLENVWVDYDPVKKKIVKAPGLPPWALPKQKAPEVEPKLRQAVLAILEPAAAWGAAEYRKAFEALTVTQRQAVAADHPRLKEIASANSAG